MNKKNFQQMSKEERQFGFIVDLNKNETHEIIDQGQKPGFSLSK